METVYVFKTSIKTKKDIKRVRPLLTAVTDITKVDFDPEDCDCILRIESQTDISSKVIGLFTACGYYCEELN